MTEPSKTPPEEKAAELRRTREALERLGVAEDRVPAPDPEVLRDGAETEPAPDGPDQSTVQPGSGAIKRKLRAPS